MKYILLILSLAMFPVVSFSADIASVNFKAIKEDLRGYYFAKPENAEIKSQFLAATQGEQQRMEAIQSSIAEGKPVLDPKQLMSLGGSGANKYQLERKIDADLRKELYFIIRSLGLEYELIYDASDADAVIYAKSQVDDVTMIVKQAIIDAVSL